MVTIINFTYRNCNYYKNLEFVIIYFRTLINIYYFKEYLTITLKIIT